MSQLARLLAELDREGTSEVVVSTGRPVMLRVHGTYQPVSGNVTAAQLHTLIHGTVLADMVAEGDGTSDLREVDVAGRRVRAQVIRNGDDILVRVEPAARQATTPMRTPVRTPPPDDPGVRFAPSRPTPPPEQLRQHAEHVRARPEPAPAPQPAGPPRHEPAPAAMAAHVPDGLVTEASEIVPTLAALVQAARQHAATDLHIAANRAVMIRRLGELVALERSARPAHDVEALLLPLLGPVRRSQLETRGYVDLAVDVPGAGRLRGNVSRQQGGLKGAFRLAVAAPATLEQLGLPPQLAKVIEHHQGLIVIAGPSGHGKTTTLAALVDRMNEADAIHILTIEDPVEIAHPRKRAVVSQREVGTHTTSFAAALKASLREDPDVIVIGELRDRETVEIAMTAAETGHLVLATMSTPSAAKSIDRLIDMFPPAEQSQARASLAGALRAVVAQRLLPSARGDGVVAAVELVVGVLPLATLIRENKLFQLPNLMQRGRAFGMLRLDDSLAEHVRAGRITADVALRAADSRKDLAAALQITTGKVALPGKGKP